MGELSNNSSGMIFVFAGTSGAGRKTIAHLIARELGFSSVVSYTTRSPRPKEIEGKDYYFTSRQAFIEADIRGEFFQTAEIDNTFYGIKKTDLLKAMNNHGNIYVIVNRYAANKFKSEYGDRAVRLFIYAGKQTILERLETRGFSYEVIERYMSHYIEEVSYRKECEHIFENMDLDQTVTNVRKAIEPYLAATMT